MACKRTFQQLRSAMIPVKEEEKGVDIIKPENLHGMRKINDSLNILIKITGRKLIHFF
jgi:hypothetical protein